MKNILLLKGGMSSEHEISLKSSEFISNNIDSKKFKVYEVLLSQSSTEWTYKEEKCVLTFDRFLVTDTLSIKIDAAIPCIHGPPGESGDIQSYFELIALPYLGCNPETSKICFNKLLTKLILENSGVQTTPFIQINDINEISKAKSFIKKHRNVYVKATNQGSSVGCFKVDNEAELEESIHKAFLHSPFVIIEKAIIGRELEIAVFEFQGDLHISNPGEIVCPSDFYTYDQKYSSESKTKTYVEAINIPEDVIESLFINAEKIVKTLKIRHLSRIDFFLTQSNEVYLNEVNTFPGHTSISMFPMMMENMDITYGDYINDILSNLAES